MPRFTWRQCVVVLVLSGFVVGVAASYATYRFILHDTNTDTISRAGGYAFINPLLTCDISEDQPYSGLDPLRSRLDTQVRSLISEGKAKRIAVYFRDMDYGRWTGVNASDEFIPASLMKVPIFIAYLKASESQPNLLTNVLHVSGTSDGNSEEFYKPSAPLAPGSYSVRKLLDAMIEQSDNNALSVLANNIPSSEMSEVYSTFGVPPAFDPNADAMSPLTYMRFFRILYNGSFLSKSGSAEALATLAKSDFGAGIMRGVPSGATVAHKFGERTINAIDKQSGHTTLLKRVLSDCGIVYFPHSPYGICIMAEGNDFSNLSDAIAELSKTAYDSVDAGLLKRE